MILYPDGRVSPRQAHQLGCFGDNVRALRVAGSFDDCQRMVKQAFADERIARTRAAVVRPTASASAACCRRWRTTRTPRCAICATHDDAAEFRRADRQSRQRGRLQSSRAHAACRSGASCWRPMPIARCTISSPAPTIRRARASRRWPTRWTSARRATSNACAGCIPTTRNCAVEFSARCASTTTRSARRSASAMQRYGEVFCPHTATAMRMLEGLRQEGGERDLGGGRHRASGQVRQRSSNR